MNYEEFTEYLERSRRPMSFEEAVNTAIPSKGFDVPPYHVESFPGCCEGGWHAVCNKYGFNCLSWPGRGAKFTTLEAATEIARRWNAKASRT